VRIEIRPLSDIRLAGKDQNDAASSAVVGTEFNG
jgi:hypothetical protein